MLEQNVRRLELDMEAEIETIRMRYKEKIRFMQEVVRLAKENQTRKNEEWAVEHQIIDDDQSLFTTSEVTDDLLTTNSPTSVIERRQQEVITKQTGKNSGMGSMLWTGPAVQSNN